MRALHEESVARATPVELTSKLPPKQTHCLKDCAWGQLRQHIRHVLRELTSKFKIITVEIAAL